MQDFFRQLLGENPLTAADRLETLAEQLRRLAEQLRQGVPTAPGGTSDRVTIEVLRRTEEAA